MRRVGLESAHARLPLMVRIVNAYASLFPDEAEEVYGVFLETTYGVTASQELAVAFERAAAAGRIGDIDAFRQRSGAAFPCFVRRSTKWLMANCQSTRILGRSYGC